MKDLLSVWGNKSGRDMLERAQGFSPVPIYVVAPKRPIFPTRLLASFVLTLAIAGCSDVTAPVGLESSAPEPQLAISDGAHAGNAHFYFLSPMVPDPSPSGTFDGSLSPEVQVCVWNGVACGAVLAIFNSNAGPGSSTVRVNVADEHYIVNWHTDEITDNTALGTGESFRVRVLVQGQLLGFADIEVVGSAKELKNVNTDEFIALKDGRTLPIKFRIEDGALSGAEARIVSAGRSRSCAVSSDGTAYCWGLNTNGELGTGVSGGFFSTPQLVTGGLTWQSVETSAEHTCGLTADGQMYCWGSNALGQLGTGSSASGSHPTPELVLGGHLFESLASLGGSSTFNSCGVTTVGEMYCWGLNSFGELGIGTTSYYEPIPVLVTGGHSFTGSAALDRRTTCGVTTALDILCWGRNDSGQLGRGIVTNFPDPSPTPALVVGGYSFKSVTVGGRHACGITTTEAALCWGANDLGDLGIGMTSGNLPSPQVVAGGHTFTQLSAAFAFTCGVANDGEGFCWGRNQFGQLGRGFISPSESTPELVNGSHTFRAMGAGSRHACGVTTTGDTYCWGRNDSGQLGNGMLTNTATPDFAIDLDP